MDAISKLSSDIRELFSTLALHIEKLEQIVEQNILKHLDKAITDRVEASVNKVKKDLSKDLNNGLANLKDEIKTRKRQFNDVVKSGENKGDQKRELNIVITNLPESQNENVNTKVNGLLREITVERDS